MCLYSLCLHRKTVHVFYIHVYKARKASCWACGNTFCFYYNLDVFILIDKIIMYYVLEPRLTCVMLN